MPKLVKVYLQQIAIGFGLSGIFTAILLYMNVGNLGHLVFNSSDGLLGLFLIFFFNGLVFAGVQFAIRIMRMGYEDDDDDDDDRGTPVRSSRPGAGASLDKGRPSVRVAGPQRPWWREFPRA